MKRRIAIVQPILSPYSIPRFEELAKNDELEIILLVEKQTFSHRPGWNMSFVKGCKVEFIDSFIKSEDQENRALGYKVSGIRAVPYRLPLLLMKYKPHIVLVCNATELLFCLPLRWYLNYKIGLMVEDTMHTMSSKSVFKQRAKVMIYRTTDFYLPLTNDSADYLNVNGIIKNIYRTSWSIDLERFRKITNEKRVQAIRKEHAVEEKLVFIFVGQLIPSKGIMKLLNAWVSLPEQIQKNIALVIIGDGPQKEEIIYFIQNNKMSNIILLGHISYEELVNYYNTADVLIFPTLQDVFGMVVMEAMACGLPVLVSQYAGAKELVKHDENGYIFDSENIEVIRNILIRAFKYRNRMWQMGNRSREIVKDYSHDNVMKKLAYLLINSESL
jgi:glycosyltransferase involved in cell wall biosynthesis